MELQFEMNHKAKIIKLTELTVKIAIVLLGIFVLYKKLFVNQNVSEIVEDIKATFTNNNQFLLMTTALLLVPLNIYLEGIKWKLQIKPIENISNWKSFLSIFTGISAGMFFPNRMGNFLGRIFMLEKGDRIKASLTTLVGGMAQMIATVSIGLISALFFFDKNIILICVILFLFVTLSLLMFSGIDSSLLTILPLGRLTSISGCDSTLSLSQADSIRNIKQKSNANNLRIKSPLQLVDYII